MREHDPRDGGVERGRYRGRDPAAHPHGRVPLGVPAEPGGEGAEGRSEVGERAVLADGGAGPERHQTRQGGEEAGTQRDPAVQPLDGADDVGRAVRAPLRYVAVRDSHDEPARGRHADGGDEQQPRILLHEAAAGRDEQPLVEEEDEVHEPDGGKGREPARHHAENGDRDDPRSRVQPPSHRSVTSARRPCRSRPLTPGHARSRPGSRPSAAASAALGLGPRGAAARFVDRSHASYRSWCRSHPMLKSSASSSRPLGTMSRR